MIQKLRVKFIIASMLSLALVLLVILVQIFQVAGDKLTLVSDKRRR